MYLGEVEGREAFVMERIHGETIGRRIVKSPPPGLDVQLAEELAKIHAIPPERLPFLETGDQVARFYDELDSVGEPHPAIEPEVRAWLSRWRWDALVANGRLWGAYADARGHARGGPGAADVLQAGEIEHDGPTPRASGPPTLPPLYVMPSAAGRVTGPRAPRTAGAWRCSPP